MCQSRRHVEGRRDPVKFPAATASGCARGAACAAGMDPPCEGIFFALRDLIVEPVRHAAAQGRAAGGRTMAGCAAHETWRPRVARTHGSARRRPSEGGAGRFVQRNTGVGRGRRARRAVLAPANLLESISCAAIPAAKGCLRRRAITGDNCRYRPQSCQVALSRRAFPPQPPAIRDIGRGTSPEPDTSLLYTRVLGAPGKIWRALAAPAGHRPRPGGARFCVR